MTTCTIAAALLVLLLFPCILLFWLSESRQQRAKRLRGYGWTQQAIADHLHCSRTTARRLLMA